MHGFLTQARFKQVNYQTKMIHSNCLQVSYRLDSKRNMQVEKQYKWIISFIVAAQICLHFLPEE